MERSPDGDGARVVQKLRWLALNLYWAWHPDARQLFAELNPNLWEIVGHNPAALLRDLGPERVGTAAYRPDYMARLERAVKRCEDYLKGASTTAGDTAIAKPVREALLAAPGPVAYFCAEFGIHESLPIYAGGLGILAGDHLKSASDLGLPLVAVGLLYREGYLRQRLDDEGGQESEYPHLDFERQPLELLRDLSGAPLTVQVDITGRLVTAQIWRARVGRVPLLLLDTDVGHNSPGDRWLTARLYSGGTETRIAQEIILAVGGLRALRVAGIQPSAFHMNEGHSAFLTLELIRERVVSRGESFEQARHEVARRCLFTTHTPVPAGHDRFAQDLVERHLGELRRQLGLDEQAFRALARDPDDPQDRFCMTVLALKGSGAANGVSALHGEVSREMWKNLWNGRAAKDVPIAHVTNGVHGGSWVSDALRALLERHLGPDWLDRIHDPRTFDAIDRLPDEELWATQLGLKEKLVAFVRLHVAKALVARGREAQSVLGSAQLLDAPVLTIGFARRFATYKRADLLLQDVERAVRLLDHPTRPVQMIFAGKAHPQDTHGQDVIRRVVQSSKHARLRNRVVFLQDYDIGIARELVQGVDVWLNNPRRPHEASGTSGQKAALNGALNASILDGWWCEGYAADPQAGFAIGDDRVDPDQAAQDRRDAEALFQVLEQQVVPLYYDRDARGVPRKWLARMKRAIKSLGPLYNTHRMVLDYARNYYVPASRGQLGG